MWTKLLSGAVYGIDGYLVEVEISLSRGLPRTVMVGLPDVGCQESCDRARAAMVNSGFDFPLGRITINLAPAFIKKAGARYDLPIALGILLASEQIRLNFKEKFLLLGELSLDGYLRSVPGVLPVCAEALKRDVKVVLVPRENAAEAALVEGINVLAVSHLREVIDFFEGRFGPGFEGGFFQAVKSQNEKKSEVREVRDFAEVKGQFLAKRALEIAAAGHHNLAMIGPPGSGKTMLARAFPSIMPELSQEEALEVTRIYSVAGRLSEGKFLIKERPFRAPHHTASEAGLIGGGASPRPGEVTLAHRGVLFLDELAEFSRRTLEVLRQPLEDGFVTISRAAHSFTYPSKFLLIAASNP